MDKKVMNFIKNIYENRDKTEFIKINLEDTKNDRLNEAIYAVMNNQNEIIKNDKELQKLIKKYKIKKL